MKLSARGRFEKLIHEARARVYIDADALEHYTGAKCWSAYCYVKPKHEPFPADWDGTVQTTGKTADLAVTAFEVEFNAKLALLAICPTCGKLW